MIAKSISIPILALLLGIGMTACAATDTSAPQSVPDTPVSSPIGETLEAPELTVETTLVNTVFGEGIFFEAEDETASDLLPASEPWHSHEEFVGVPPHGNRPGPSGGGNWYLSRNGESLTYEFDVPASGDYLIFVRDFSSDDWPPGHRSMRIAVDGIDLGLFAENEIRAAYPPGVFGWHETATVTLQTGLHTMTVTKEGPVQAGPLLDAFYLTTNPDDDPEFTLTLETAVPATQNDPTPSPDAPVIDNGGSGGMRQIVQYAATATASSEYSADFKSAMQATGAPDTPSCGTKGTAWSPETPEGDDEWIEVGFEIPVFAFGISVYESFSGYFLRQIDLIDVDGGYHVGWAGTDTFTCPTEMIVTFDQTDYVVVGAKIHTRINALEEIDAVRIGGLGPAN